MKTDQSRSEFRKNEQFSACPSPEFEVAETN